MQGEEARLQAKRFNSKGMRAMMQVKFHREEAQEELLKPHPTKIKMTKF